MTKLPFESGRGGLTVCPKDVDKPDYGLISYRVRAEKPIKFTRINHTNVANSSPIYDLEADTVDNISSYQYLAPSQVDGVVLVLSQNEDIWLATSQTL